MNEERFWRNYFYRVSLVRQSALGDKTDDEAFISKEVGQDEKAEASSKQDSTEECEETEVDSCESSTERNQKLKTIRDTVAEATLSSELLIINLFGLAWLIYGRLLIRIFFS